jgi:hypothetical protein
MSYTTIYVVGALLTLTYYFLSGGKRLYKEIKEVTPEVPDNIIQASVKISIVIYSLFWFIAIPFIILPKIFKK